jgi:hypothetical protein
MAVFNLERILTTSLIKRNLSITTLAGLVIVSSQLHGYFTGLSYVLIGVFSSNRHDRSVEATMTSFLVWALIGFVLCFIAGYSWAKRSL